MYCVVVIWEVVFSAVGTIRHVASCEGLYVSLFKASGRARLGSVTNELGNKEGGGLARASIGGTVRVRGGNGAATRVTRAFGMDHRAVSGCLGGPLGNGCIVQLSFVFHRGIYARVCIGFTSGGVGVIGHAGSVVGETFNVGRGPS